MPKEIELPPSRKRSKTSVEESIAGRRSVRSYSEGPLILKEISQLLWAAQGITRNTAGDKCRAIPSAGATYPLKVYLVAGEVEGLEAGFYCYQPRQHFLSLIRQGDLRQELSQAAPRQSMIMEAPGNLIITAIYEKTTARYGERGFRYVHMEVGHLGENIHLQCESLGLGTVVIGAFNDRAVKEVLGLEMDETPLYIMPAGRK